MHLASRLPVADDFDAEYLEHYQLLPLEVQDGELLVASAGSTSTDVLDELTLLYGYPIRLIRSEPSDLAAAIRRTFAAAQTSANALTAMESTNGTEPQRVDLLSDVRDLAAQPPIVRYVNILIREAHEARASDIHLEATASGLRVRLRIDGVLQELAPPPSSQHAAIVSRVKLLAELDIAERRLAQDGRTRLRLEERELDLRVATTPTIHGESVVLRLLDAGARPASLDDLGLSPDLRARFERLAARANGILLSTGPTGSGKTTTLHAALRLRDRVAEKIISVEDPIEYFVEGVTQVPVNSKAGVTFGSALRSILRQDPDVLMIGEIRDGETAGIAVQSAMTGHLVLSTLHTNDAIGAIARLRDLGIEPYMIAATVEAVLAQRLVRRNCMHCQSIYRPDPALVALLACGPRIEAEFSRGAGCELCRQTGFRGRIGLFELLVMSDELKSSLLQAPDPARLRSAALSNGMVSLREDAWHKVQAGLTTIEEVLRVLPL